MKETIDSHSFMLDHLSVRNPKLIAQSGLKHEQREFLVLDSRTLPSFSSLRDPIGTEQLFLIGTLHGVVCLYDIDIGLRLWNPSTREFSSRPLPPLPPKEDFRWDTLNQRYYNSGFWIDPSNKDFKVIMFEYAMEAVLYKSVEEGWIGLHVGEHVETCVGFMHDDYVNVSPALMIGGVAYWPCEYEGELNGDGAIPIESGILSFDFGQEIFDLIVIPKTNLGILDQAHFNWQGNLSLLYLYKEQKRCDVYSRQEGKATLVKMYSINFVSPMKEVFWVLDEMKGDGRVLASTDNELVLYDTRVGCIPLKGQDWKSYHFCMANDFVESLLFPYH